MGKISDLWEFGPEDDWRRELDRYREFITDPEIARLDAELEALDLDLVRGFDANQWFSFLKEKYFKWKYTAKNRYATTTSHLSKYRENDKLEELLALRDQILSSRDKSVEEALKTACQVRGLGVAGGAGLLAVLFPDRFATVDQFVVFALRDVKTLPERQMVWEISNPENLTFAEGAQLIEIMKNKASKLSSRFGPGCWTPRMVDKVLWTIGHEAESFLQRSVHAANASKRPPNRSTRSHTTSTNYLTDSLGRASPEVRDLFLRLKAFIMRLSPNVREKVLTQNLAYSAGQNFVEMYVQKTALKILLRPLDYHDPEGMIKRIPDSHGWTLNRYIFLRDAGQLDYVEALVKRSYGDV